MSGATSPTWDANGNMTTDETGRTFVFDAWNRLVTVKNSSGTTIAGFSYDALSRRITTTESGTTTDMYFSAAGQVLEERVGSAVKAQNIWSPVYVDALILRDRDSTGGGTLNERLWVVQDANFNVTALLNNSGSVVERYAYDPYSAVTILSASFTVLSSSAYAWVYLNQGSRFDFVTGLYHHGGYGGRDLDPNLMRWIEEDPLRTGVAPWYGDEGNNPVNRVDPSGLKDKEDPAVGAKGTIDQMVDKLCWPEDKKAKIKDLLHRLIDTAQFPWHRDCGFFGYCEEWVDEFYPKVKDIISELTNNGISICKITWSSGTLSPGYHHGVRITVHDSSGCPNGNNTFTIYLDDSNLGGPDHVFVDKEIPSWRYREVYTYKWFGPAHDTPESCGGLRRPIGPGRKRPKPFLTTGPSCVPSLVPGNK